VTHVPSKCLEPNVTAFAEPFLWGASTAAHQVEGNNVNSDLWLWENAPDSPFSERSGDACDSLHRWEEDLDLVAELGLNAYRFSLEWARIEPAREHVSSALLAHYRRMIDGCLERDIQPVVTLHHFSSPQWFRQEGGWLAPDAPQWFAAYAAAVAPILDGVEWVCTINEPNMIAMVQAMRVLGDSAEPALPAPEMTAALVRAHHAARDALSALTRAKLGWTVANQNVQPLPGCERQADEVRRRIEDDFLLAAAGDDFIGVQAYTRMLIDSDGRTASAGDVPRTLMGWEDYPAALGEAVRHTRRLLPHVPVLVTENGIATADCDQRIAYTRAALDGLRTAMADGADVRGYLHWSLLDNYEWGSYAPTFGLVCVDRQDFTRSVKPSGRWYGALARAGGREPAIAAGAPAGEAR
jgi:beta-glucosidase